MYQGQLMAYKIQLFPMIRTTWLTEITQMVQDRLHLLNRRVLAAITGYPILGNSTAGV